MFSGIISRAGRLRTFPDIEELSQSNQSYFLLLAVKESLIASNDLDFSLTLTTSPGRTVYEGILTTSPLTVMCL